MYFLDTNFQDNKTILFELKRVYGIGHSKSIMICQKLGFSPNYKISELSFSQLNKLYSVTKNFKLNSNLKQIEYNTWSKLVKIKSYKGLRKLKGFPVRGQRTRSNAKTSKKITGKLV